MENISDIEVNERDIRTITTSLPKDIVKYIKDRRYKYNELIRLGIHHKEDFPPILNRLNNTESKFELIIKKIDMILDYLEVMNTKGKSI